MKTLTIAALALLTLATSVTECFAQVGAGGSRRTYYYKSQPFSSLEAAEAAMRSDSIYGPYLVQSTPSPSTDGVLGNDGLPLEIHYTVPDQAPGGIVEPHFYQIGGLNAGTPPPATPCDPDDFPGDDGCRDEGDMITRYYQYLRQTYSSCEIDDPKPGGSYASPFLFIDGTAPQGYLKLGFGSGGTTQRWVSSNWNCPRGSSSIEEHSFQLASYTFFYCPVGFNAVDTATALAIWPKICRASGPAPKITSLLNQFDSCPSNKNPCHPQNGDKSRNESDFDFAGRSFVRYYHSTRQVGSDGVLGPGWTHSYSDRISHVGNTILWIQENGNLETFEPTGSQAYRSVNRPDYKLSRVNEGGYFYRLTGPDGLVRDFNDTTGRLNRIYSATSADFRVDISYDGQLKMRQLTDAKGRQLIFNYAGNHIGARLVSIQSGDSTYTYVHDATGNLSAIQYPDDKMRQYHYGEPALASALLKHHLTGITDEAGRRYASFSYDSIGRVTSSRLFTGSTAAPEVAVTTISYPTNTSATVVAASGEQLTHQYGNDFFRKPLDTVTSQGTIHNTYAPNSSRLLTTTDRRQVTTEYGYDPQGFRSATTEAVGTPQERRTVVQRDPIHHQVTRQETYAKVGAQFVLDQVTATYYDAAARVAARCTMDPAAAAAYVCDAAVTPSPGAKVRRWTYTYCTQADVDAPNSTCPILGLTRSVNGPRASTDAGMGGLDDVAMYTYRNSTDESGCGSFAGPCHHKGDLWKVTSALGHVAETVAYDRNGRVKRSKDVNGTITDFSYNARGNLVLRMVRAKADGSQSLMIDSITTFFYDDVGNITRMIQPDGAYLNYTYDDARRVTDIVDNLGNRLHYTLDAAGNRVKEETFDASYNPAAPGVGLKRAMSRQYDVLNHLTKTLNAANAPTRDSTPFNGAGLSNGYDANGNAVHFRDGLGIETRQDYDPLNRLARTIQDYVGSDPETAQATTEYGYDARNNLRTVKDPGTTSDPLGLTTTYTYDGLNDLVALDSPDTGHTDYEYDRAGNRTRQIDSRVVASTYTYDALNRLTSIAYPTVASNVTFAYDQSNAVTGCGSSFPLGRLTRMTDESGSTTYCYDRRGNVTQKRQATSSTLTVAYTYTKADRLDTMTYPSGSIASYTRDATGRTTGLSWKPNAAASSVTVIGAASYYPFGPLNQLTFGNGRTLTKTYDADYAIDKVASSDPNGLALDFRTTVMGNIVEASDVIGATAPTRKYIYDNLYRLTRVNDGGNFLKEDYAYNKTGDRTLKQFAGQSAQVYTYLAGTHRLGSVAGVARSYDANGNTTDRGDGKTLGYDDRNRLHSVASGKSGATKAPPPNQTINAYNGRGERVSRGNSQSVQATNWMYNEGGQTIGTYFGFDTLGTEILYLDNMPVAQVDPARNLSYLETDHLGTPRVAADRTTNAQQWRWGFLESAFGEHAPAEIAGGIGVDLRYPGQVFGAETGMHYNYFRDYEAGTGRYVESDPVGIRGGLSTYTYSLSSPMLYSDPLGLATWKGGTLGGGITYGALTLATLKSPCPDGGTATADVLLFGGQITPGAPVSFVGTSLSLDDSNTIPTPDIFEGWWGFSSVSIVPGFGSQYGNMFIGGAYASAGWAAAGGFNLSAGGGGGRTWVIRKRYCELMCKPD